MEIDLTWVQTARKANAVRSLEAHTTVPPVPTRELAATAKQFLIAARAKQAKKLSKLGIEGGEAVDADSVSTQELASHVATSQLSSADDVVNEIMAGLDGSGLDDFRVDLEDQVPDYPVSFSDAPNASYVEQTEAPEQSSDEEEGSDSLKHFVTDSCRELDSDIVEIQPAMARLYHLLNRLDHASKETCRKEDQVEGGGSENEAGSKDVRREGGRSGADGAAYFGGAHQTHKDKRLS
jgi:hypothetical protein